VKKNPVDGDVVAGTDAVDAEDNPAEEEVELKAKPNIGFDFVDCQLESNKLEVVPPIALLVLASEEEAEELSPKAAPELKSFAEEVEAANRELPEERAVFPANPKDGDDEVELNCMGMLLLKVETPETAVDACALSTDPLPAPKREPSD
jgi:hypothetical protein